jgi:hypothetical protein
MEEDGERKERRWGRKGHGEKTAKATGGRAFFNITLIS